MTYTPVISGAGYTGWRMLNRTLDRQMSAMNRTPEMQRDQAYFREHIGQVGSAADLVADRRLLKVALGAFGLDSDLNNRAFIRKILQDGTLSSDALSNKLADKRYAEMSRAFGFDLAVPRSKMSDFADKILGAYQERQFEVSVGTVNGTMRLALNAKRELSKIGPSEETEMSKWYKILGSPPLRRVMETVFSLPSSFAAIDLDQQVGVVRDKAQAMFGSSDPGVFVTDEGTEKIIRLFTIRSDLQMNRAGAGFAVALQLLSGLG